MRWSYPRSVAVVKNILDFTHPVRKVATDFPLSFVVRVALTSGAYNSCLFRDGNANLSRNPKVFRP